MDGILRLLPAADTLAGLEAIRRLFLWAFGRLERQAVEVRRCGIDRGSTGRPEPTLHATPFAMHRGLHCGLERGCPPRQGPSNWYSVMRSIER